MIRMFLIHAWRTLPTPLPVDPSRDWLDYVSAFSGLIGALLAAVAIIYAARQSTKAKQDLVRERRLEFELSLLAEIRRQLSVTQFQHLSGYVGALVTDPGNETDIPLVRAVVGTKLGPLGRQRMDQIHDQVKSQGGDVRGAWAKAAEEEVDSAIQRRLKK
jgi:hypothetical protein